jgi:hypothetical protein
MPQWFRREARSSMPVFGGRSWFGFPSVNSANSQSWKNISWYSWIFPYYSFCTRRFRCRNDEFVYSDNGGVRRNLNESWE